MITPDTSAAPTGRMYGVSYEDTAALDLAQLAVWLMAELVTSAADPDAGLPPEARYAALVYPGGRSITFVVFGIDPADAGSFATAQEIMNRAIKPVLHAHNWHNPDDPHDHRFLAAAIVPNNADHEHALRAQGHGPGTVTVFTDE
ncbi:hypothetical protein ACWEV3_40215 [Saccharopolyspora sp. NPDC003752]